MLFSLSIRDIAFIKSLDFEFSPGLNVLTGETGAGKSILLDALGLALGGRVGSGSSRGNLLRAGAERGSVSAVFAIDKMSNLVPRLEQAGIDCHGSELVLRRVITADGRSRAFINDQAVGISTLREISGPLVELHGQKGDRILTDRAGHREFLDAFANEGSRNKEVVESWREWQAVAADLANWTEKAGKATADREYIEYSLDEIRNLAPLPGEEEELDKKHRLFRVGQKIGEEVKRAAELMGENGAENMSAEALRRIEQVAPQAQEQLDAVVESLEKAYHSVAEAAQLTERVFESLATDEGELERLEERLFTLREVARKHRVSVEELPQLQEQFAHKLAEIEDCQNKITQLQEEEQKAKSKYFLHARALHKARLQAGHRLDEGISSELPPLKLNHARFRTHISELPEEKAGPRGISEVRFEVSTAPDLPLGPIDKLASGGELSRFLLALKSQVVGVEDRMTVIFDEIDRGIGGATADAVGSRLKMMGEEQQLLVITHSPQVAARGDHHWRIRKIERDKTYRAEVEYLDASSRLEEIARMLSGTNITEEARAAARSLLA